MVYDQQGETHNILIDYTEAERMANSQNGSLTVIKAPLSTDFEVIQQVKEVEG